MNDIAWHTIETMGRLSFDEEYCRMFANADHAYQNGEVGDNHPYSGTNDRAFGAFRRAICDNGDRCPPTHILINSATAWDLDYRRPVYWVYFHYLCHVIECADSCC